MVAEWAVTQREQELLQSASDDLPSPRAAGAMTARSGT